MDNAFHLLQAIDFAGISLATLGSSALVAGQADAAQQMADLASDNRLGSILFLLAPALGWVGFNILGPFQNQLNNMQDKKALAAGLGISAAAMLAMPETADAAQEVMAIAADKRFATILVLLFPAIGWVLFNIAGPFLNQLNNMQNKKALAAGLGLSAAALLSMPETADAAQEVMTVAGDNRLGSILFLLAPALGWVGFNILGPFQNQLNNMQDKKALAGGLGISAAAMLAMPETADAAQEVMAVAADNRLGSILFLLFPAIGWVLFNILGPFQNQLKNMQK